MVQNDLSQKYSKRVSWIHWITAVLILTLFPMGKYMAGIEPVDKVLWVQAHAILGTIILIATIFRSVLFFKDERPPDLKTGSKINDLVAVWIHNIFYILLFTLSISGLLSMYTGGYVDAILASDGTLMQPNSDTKPLNGHGFMAFLMMVLLTLHVLGALKHYIFTKENTLKRIW